MGNFVSQHVVVPKFTIDDVPGTTFGGFLMDKYISSQPNARADTGHPDVANSGAVGSVPTISRPGVPVWDYITFPQAMIACCNRGKGWHLTSAFEWSSVAFLAKKFGTQPHGGNANTNPPSDVDYPSETALKDQSTSYNRALPGTGPPTWAHNHHASGIYDLQGLVWQWVMMFMTTDGYPQIPANLDLTYMGSPYGRGTISGSGGSTPTLTVDGAGVNWKKNWADDAFNGMQVYIAEAGAFYDISDTTATSIQLADSADPGDGTATFVIVRTVATDITAGMSSGNRILTLRDSDADLGPLAIPATSDATGSAAYGNDGYWFDKTAVRAARRGGYFDDGVQGGVCALSLGDAPSDSGCSIAPRACKAL